MNKKTYKVSRGFTLIEMMITIAVMSIILSAIGIIIVDGQRCWQGLYSHINSDVVTDGYAARKKFDAEIRNSSSEKIIIDPYGNWIELYYYSSSESTAVDRYLRFYAANGGLNIEYGTLDPRITTSIESVCENVTDCTFKQIGRSVQMILTIDNGTQTNTVVTSAVTQN